MKTLPGLGEGAENGQNMEAETCLAAGGKIVVWKQSKGMCGGMRLHEETASRWARN